MKLNAKQLRSYQSSAIASPVPEGPQKGYNGLMIVSVSIGLLLIILIINFFYNRRTKDLEDRNRRLRALRMLDEITISASTDSLNISQKVIDAIPYVLGFDIGLLAPVDEKTGSPGGMTISNTPAGISLKQSLPAGAVLNDSFLSSISRTTGIKDFLTFPVVVKDKAIGTLAVGTSRKFTREDRENLKDLVNVVGIAMDNARIYRQISETTALLTQTNQKLKAADQLKDDFVSIASHELRTPMTAIRSYAWMALHRSDVALSPTLEKYIARILISTQRLVNLVNDMLNISRIESGKIEIVPEPVDLLSLVKDIIDEVYYSKSEEKKLEFVVLGKPVPKVFADPEKLRQVFLNLVGNSLKFTPNGGKITFDFFSDGKTVEISISDTGVGILREDISKLFHKFSRLDNSYTAAASSGGTGLGLYISRNLVELMHGKIRVSSEGVGKGATFTVSLPVATFEAIKNTEKYTIRPAGGQVKPLEPVAI